MTTTEFDTKRKIYEQPELKVMDFELGVYGDYGDPDDPRPEITLGFGISAQ